MAEVDTIVLSDYEKLRLKNIQRNERRLKELGLDEPMLPRAVVAAEKRRKVLAKSKAGSTTDESINFPLRRSTRRRLAPPKTYLEEEGEDDVPNAEKTNNDDDDKEDDDDDEYWEKEGEDGDHDERESDHDTAEKVSPVGAERKQAVTTMPNDRNASTPASYTSSTIVCETAKSGRSTCRKCRVRIPRHGPRVGMRAWIAGRDAMTWQCPPCFLSNLVCAREVTGRSRCRATRATFGKGEIKVGARSHTAASFFRVDALADAVLVPVLRTFSEFRRDVRAESVEGFEDVLRDDERETLRSVFDAALAWTGEGRDPRTTKTETGVESVGGKKELETSSSAKKLGSKKTAVKAKSGKVKWKYGGHTCLGTLLPKRETKTHCYARTRKGNIKTLDKGKSYWSVVE